MTDVFYRWPEAARVGSRVPKEKIYGQGTATAATRERFVSEVAQITWAYKLAESTINLPESDAVPEIQVFRVDAKEEDVSEQVLAAIDRAIPFPIIFEIKRTNRGIEQVRATAAHKQPGVKVIKTSQYFSTGWIDAEAERRPLPTAISLSALYVALLEPLTEVAVRQGETMSEVADRLKEVGKLEREITALQRRIRNEKQLNRKIELRRTLKTREAQLEQQR